MPISPLEIIYHKYKYHIELQHNSDSSKNDDTTQVETLADEENVVNDDGDIKDVRELGLGLSTALSPD